jgi:hypothetical protein
MQKILNQEGFMEAPSFILLLLLSSLLLGQLLVWQKRRADLRQHHREVICAKKAMLITESLVSKVNTLNLMLSSGKVAQIIGLLFPGKGWLVAANWEKAKKIIMGLQEAAYLEAQFKYLKLKNERCSLPWKIFLTPYKHKLKFARSLDATILRSESDEWTIKTPLLHYRITWALESNLQTKINWKVQ